MKTMQDKTLTVEEVERRYPNEWVLLESIHAHKHHPRVKGRLLAHSSNREGLDEPFERFRAEHPDARTYEFYTGDIVSADRDFIVVL